MWVCPRSQAVVIVNARITTTNPSRGRNKLGLSRILGVIRGWETLPNDLVNADPQIDDGECRTRKSSDHEVHEAKGVRNHTSSAERSLSLGTKLVNDLQRVASGQT
jgi:hypothetical protein